MSLYNAVIQLQCLVDGKSDSLPYELQSFSEINMVTAAFNNEHPEGFEDSGEIGKDRRRQKERTREREVKRTWQEKKEYK